MKWKIKTLKIIKRNQDFTIVTGGSKSFSPSTSIHVISKAPGSPGEQGVNRSSTICVLSRGEGPRTRCGNKSHEFNGNSKRNFHLPWNESLFELSEPVAWAHLARWWKCLRRNSLLSDLPTALSSRRLRRARCFQDEFWTSSNGRVPQAAGCKFASRNVFE